MSSFCQNKVCNHQTNNLNCQKLLSSVDVYSSWPLLKCRLQWNAFVASWFLNLHSSLVTLRVGSAPCIATFETLFPRSRSEYLFAGLLDNDRKGSNFSTTSYFYSYEQENVFSWQITITQLSRVCSLFVVYRASQIQHLQRFLLEETATLNIKKSSQGIPSVVLLSCCIW